jgi:hypothetical protein
MNVRPSHIRRGHNGYRVGQGHHRARYTDAQVARARALREEGWKLEAIAAEVGANPRTVWDWINHNIRQFG